MCQARCSRICAHTVSCWCGTLTDTRTHTHAHVDDDGTRQLKDPLLAQTHAHTLFQTRRRGDGSAATAHPLGINRAISLRESRARTNSRGNCTGAATHTHVCIERERECDRMRVRAASSHPKLSSSWSWHVAILCHRILIESRRSVDVSARLMCVCVLVVCARAGFSCGLERLLGEHMWSV